MPFQTPITIKKALENIHRHRYVLPAIQREFEWDTDQIRGLFDSLLRDYPIGSFLFWKVTKETSRNFVFYDFIRNYHQLKGRYCPVLDLPGDQEVVAVLDGQQRLTALNIALHGSHSECEPNRHRNKLKNYPEKHLYLNLAAMEQDQDNELQFQYQLRFLTKEAAKKSEPGVHWYRVGDVLDLRAGPPMAKYLRAAGLQDADLPFETLDRLHRVVHLTECIHYYEEEEQLLDKVLRIFIRLNSGGTPLSQSDILLSIATAQWKDLDARKVIQDFIEELNGSGKGFSLSKDLVLKAGLMLADTSSIAFKVTTFSPANMKQLEQRWPQVASALRMAVQLFSIFGFSEKTLSADSVLIPVAYYIHHRALEQRYLTSPSWREDREKVRTWVLRSLLKGGVWGSGLDTTLLALRKAIQTGGKAAFPTEALDAELAKRGKKLSFTDEEIDGLADIEFGDRRVFPLLALLFPASDVRNDFDIDHVFPRALFKGKNLRKEGVPDDRVEVFADKANRLGNLHLLESPANQGKNDALPAEWLKKHFGSASKTAAYCERNDFGELPESIKDFDDFYEQRRTVLRKRIAELLGVSLGGEER